MTVQDVAAYASIVGVVGLVAAIVLATLQVRIMSRQTRIFEQQMEFGKRSLDIVEMQQAEFAERKARQPVLSLGNEFEGLTSRNEFMISGPPGQESQINLFLVNDGSLEASDISISLFVPNSVYVYHDDGRTPRRSDYVITDYVILNDPTIQERDGEHLTHHHRLRQKFRGPFYPGETYPVGYINAVVSSDEAEIRYKIVCRDGTFPKDGYGVLTLERFGYERP